MSIADMEQAGQRSSVASIPAWLFAGAGIYLLLLIRGDSLLNDPDMLWQIKIGQWIVAHHAVPFTDIYSFTRAGAPWMSSSWLAQVLFAEAFALGGWAGVVILSALVAAAGFALFTHILCRFLPPLQVSVVVGAVLVLSMSHLLARPHVLALPVMIAWVSGLVSASGRGKAPPFSLLPPHGAPLAMLRAIVSKGVLKGADTGQTCAACIYVPRSGRRDGEPVTLVAEQEGPIWYSSRACQEFCV